MKDSRNLLTVRWIAVFTAIFCWAAWGTAFPLIKKCYQLFGINGTGSSLLFGGVRFTCAGTLLLIFISFRNGHFPVLKAKELKMVLILGSVQTGLVYFFQYIALNYCSGTNSAIINALQPLFMTVFAHIIFKNDSMTVKKIVGIAIGFGGVLVCLMGDGNLTFTLMGEGFLMISSLMFSLGSNLAKIVSSDLKPDVTSAYNLVIGGIELVVIGLCSGGNMSDGGTLGYSLFVVLALISSVCFLLWTAVCTVNNVSSLAPFQFVNPIVGALLSSVLLGENLLQPKYLIALVMVSAGILIATTQSKKA